MSLELSKLLSSLPMGVVLRQRDKRVALLQQLTHDGKNQYQMGVDNNGEYTFTPDIFQFSEPNHRMFYDGAEKVLEYFYDGQTLSVQIFTLRQANLFIDIEIGLCRIQAAGALCIEGRYLIESTLNIEAQALIFGGTVQCQERLGIHSVDGLHLFGHIEAKQMCVVANYYTQTANITVHEHYDVAVQFYQKSDESLSKAQKIRMITKVCVIEGLFEVFGSSFLVAQHLIFGSVNVKSSIQLPAQHHIHAEKCILEGETNLVLGARGVICTDAQWLVDKLMSIDASSSFESYHTMIQSKKIENQGRFCGDSCTMVFETLIQKHDFQLLKSNVFVKKIHMESGRSRIIASHMSGEKTYVFGGELDIQNESTVGLSDKLMIDKGTTLTVRASLVKVGHKISLQGTVDLEKATISSKIFYSFHQINIRKSELVTDILNLQVETSVSGTNFRAKNVTLSGNLYLDDLEIYAQNVEYNASHASITKNYIKAEQIVLYGGPKEKNLKLKKCRLIARNFTVYKNVFLAGTTFIGVDDEDMCHAVNGHLTLSRSQFITNSRIHSLVGTSIHPCEFSKIRANVVDLAGDLNVDDSLVRCSTLNLNGGMANLQAGRIYADQSVGIHHAKLILDNDSELSARNLFLIHQSQLRLKTSNILLSNKMVSISGSQIKSNHSVLASKTAILQGSLAFIDSLLSADELLIYERFVAQSSIVRADKTISFAKTADAEINTSVVSGQNIDSFGALYVEDSQLQAQEMVSLWSGSKTTLEGGSLVTAHDALIRGAVVIKKKNQESSISPTLKPSIIVKNQLDISPNAKLYGDEDLNIVTDVLNQFGDVSLGDARFSAKGRQYNKYGALRAGSVYLGFDDAVVNQGSMSAKDITIHSNLMNILGRIYAKQTMSCSGFVNLNMGLIAANNYNNDSFISVNSGGIVPNFSVDDRYIFSWSNVIASARTLALMWAPMHTSGVQLAFTIPGFLSNASIFYQRSRQVSERGLSGMRRHEYMPILCQAKSLLLLGHGVVNQSHMTYCGEESLAWQSTYHKLTDSPGLYANEWQTTLQTTPWQQVGARTAQSMTGSYTDTSVVHTNLGISFATNTSKANWMHVNMGHEHSVFSHHINTYSLNNHGQSTGRESSFLATHMRNRGQLSGSERFNLQAKTVDNTEGRIQGKGGIVSIEELTQKGQFELEDGYLRVDAFQDDKQHAKTTLTRVVIDGKKLDSVGDLHLKDVLIKETEHVMMGADNQSSMDNVQIVTNLLDVHGKLGYQHQLLIQAQQVRLGKGSVVNGQQTPEDQLFVPVEGGESDAKPMFKPQHMLIIESPKVGMAGLLKGGDYTQIQGVQSSDETQDTPKCDELRVDDSADIALKHGTIAAKSWHIDGQMVLDNFRVNVEDTKIGQQHGLSLKHSDMKGLSLHASGLFDLSDDSQAHIDEVSFDHHAHPELIDSSLVTHSLQDESQLGYAGQSSIVADKYRHTGFVGILPQGKDKKNTLFIQAKETELDGGGHLDNAVYHLSHFRDAAQFVAGLGQYARYQMNQSLSLITEDDVSLSNPIARECDISVKAASIVSSFDYDKAYRLSFVSTQGDITLNNSLKALNIYATSARNIFENGVAYASDKLFFDAQGHIENRKYIGSGKYTQLLAKGNVLNLCEEQAYPGQYDSRRNYRAGVISGGTGSDNDGIGLYIKSNGQVIADASDFISQGSNYIEGTKGVSLRARHHVYTAFREQHKVHQSNFLKKCKDVLAKEYVYSYGTGTDIGVSHLLSGNGRNIIRSGEGGVTSVAAQFSSPGGTDVYAKDDVKLYSLKTNHHIQGFKSDWWGLQKTDQDYFYQSSSPTLFVDNGLTRIHSSEGNIDARGAYFIGAGDLEMRAKKRIILGVGILDHDMTEKNRSLQWSIPGIGAWDTYKQGGGVWNIGAAFDPSLGKMSALSQSQNGAERLVNTTNLGIDLANTCDLLMRGFGPQGNITDELLARYGLGHGGHLAPSVTLSLTQKKTRTQFQTQELGGIERGGNAVFIAGEGVDINGGNFHVDGNMEFDTPSLRIHGNPLHSKVQHTMSTESFGFVGLEGIQSLGLSYTKSHASSTHYINAVLSAGGNMGLHHHGGKMQECELDAANIQAQSLDANIGALTIQDRQDSNQIHTQSLSLSSVGQIGFYQGKGQNQTTSQHSGIDVTEGINTGDHKVEVSETHMIGGKITTDGVNHFKTGQLTAEPLIDTEYFHGIGFSGNLRDLGRVLGQKPGDSAGEPLIASLALQMDAKDYVAMQIPVVFGQQGTALDHPNIQGHVETHHAGGEIVTKNHATHFTVDLPITNEPYLKRAEKHFVGAKDQSNAMLSPKPLHHEPVDFGRPEPLAPVEPKTDDASHRRRRRRKNNASEEHIDPVEAISNSRTKPKKQNTTAVATMAKAYGNGIFDELAKATDPDLLNQSSHLIISNKERLKGGKHFRKLGGMWSLGMNLEDALLDDDVAKEDKLKKGVALTAVDLCMDGTMKTGLKALGQGVLSGPISSGLLIFELADAYYDEQTIQRIRHQGVENLAAAQDNYHRGRFFSGWALERAAADQMGSAARAEAGHVLGSVSNGLANRLVAGFNTIKNKVQPSNHVEATNRR